MSEHPWDFVIIGSGFGGSVSAWRLIEKGYRVLMLEKGRRFGPDDFAKSNWDLRRWMWMPKLGMRGIFQMTFFRHITALSGVGVGGGSLVYANTLPIPKDDFFGSPSWSSLADWKRELAPHYQTVRKMLGAVTTPFKTEPDEILAQIGRERGLEHESTTVAVHFGKPGVTVPDPYFDGAGPERTGCTQCGACMVGCRVGAKNTLDKNYLYLAEKRGLEIRAETEVTWVRALGAAADGSDGYEVSTDGGERIKTRNVIFAGGVLGTVPLLLKLKASGDGLPRVSDALGGFVRTNSEALIGVITRRKDVDLSKGIAIGSILQTDAHSHLEPVRYPEGSGFFRLLGAPHVTGPSFATRFTALLRAAAAHPLATARAYLVKDWAKSTMILLYMRTLEGHLRMKLGMGGRVTTKLESGPAPTANIPEAEELAKDIAKKLDGEPMTLVTETLGGIPTTAHILGGCVMSDSAAGGVIDHRHRVFGYEGLYVIDGSAVSANPGVNPALTISALAERAMTFIERKPAST